MHNVKPLFKSVANISSKKEVGVIIQYKSDKGRDSRPSSALDVLGVRDIRGDVTECLSSYDGQRITKDFFVSFNVDVEQAYDHLFYDKVIKIRNAVPEHIRVVLEVSEPSLPQFDAYLIDMMDVLYNQNIHFSVGDFDITSSSLLYLESTRFSLIKMAPTLADLKVNRLAHPELVDSLVNMVRDLNMHLIADGVNSPQQHVLLEQCGVNLITGTV